MKKLYILILFTILFFCESKAQSNFSFYAIEKQSNSSQLNPAFLTSQTKLSFSILPFAGINFAYNNKEVIKKLISNVISGNEAMSDYRDVFDSMIKLNLFYQRTEINLLSVGFNSAIGSFDFRIKENLQFLAKMNGEYAAFITTNTTPTLAIGDSQDFPAFISHYSEYSLGYAKELIKNKLQVGIRAKRYFGKSVMSSAITGTSVMRDQNVYLQMFGNLKVSLPIQITLDQNSLLRAAKLTDDFSVLNYVQNRENTGWGIDLGINYTIAPKLNFSASIVDFGIIKWRSNLNSMKFNGEYQFPKEYIVSNENGILTRNQTFSLETVDIRELYKIEPDQAEFSTQLPLTIYSALKYRLSPNTTLNITDRFISINSMNFNSLMATWAFSVSNHFTINGGYGVIGESFVNIPLNMLYSGSFGQFYLGTDNILSLVSPTSSGFSGVTFGLNFNLFRSKPKFIKRIGYLPFYEEKIKSGKK